ncbi:hypothetical protein M433DRAFT_548786 [Acidomyces richmondensis BFW]|nr:MAG: hypothetical protein FE78DRAFT_535032 [Acidomyces sp. 'richmondensis']KYG47584.1 hypothetical protein M433DRAFT_548786 [Acidomyces richmondensis BFW]
MSKLAQLEKELAEARENVETCNGVLEFDPDDVDANETKALMENLISYLEAQIAAEKGNSATQVNALPTPPPPPPPPNDGTPPPPPTDDIPPRPRPPKYDMNDSNAPQQVFAVKDVVMAKYSEDKQWYQATVVSKTGSSTDPLYTVIFKGYGNTETKRKNEIRALHQPESKKRKADGSPAISATSAHQSATPASGNAGTPMGGRHVISAAPSVDRSLVQQKREPSKVSDGPTRLPPEPKKLKGNKALEKGKANWQAFSAKGPMKKGNGALPKKKESMFRTPDLPNAKVGFTGSGKPMQKDQERLRWQFDKDAEDED